MAFILRRLVSTNKRRFQQDGYDLDLSYITPRVIAMGFPCDGVSRLYRNPLDEVVRLLEERHAGHYMVYNLCVERGYDPRVFQGRVMRVPMYDGQAPPLHLMLEVCRDAAAWLAADPSHVVAVHCKAGKGRTGAMVCALLLAMDPELGPASLEKTLALWAKRRTKDAKGLSIPSQRRFVGHFLALLLTARASGSMPVSNGAASQGQKCNHPQAFQQQQKQEQGGPAVDGKSAQWPADAVDSWLTHPGVPRPLSAAALLHCAVRLLRLRFRGLPPWLLRDCTASVWWRPVGHHEAHAMCHVHTRLAAGCAEFAPGAALLGPAADGAAVGGVAWAIQSYDVSSGGGAFGGALTNQELCLNLTALAPLPSPPPPSPLPYYTPYSPLSADRDLTADGWGPVALDALASNDASVSAPSMPATAQLTYFDPTNPELGERVLGAAGQGERNPGGGAAQPGPPVVSGDLKIQIFRGALNNPPHDVFKGSVTQFSAWVCTSYFNPRTNALELGRGELDKLSKRLRRWPGAVGVVIEYEVLAR